jgi:hypothetical protein
MPDVVEQRKKACVILPIDRLQLNLRGLNLRPYPGIEEVAAAVVALENAPVRLFRHRRELVHIPDQQYLYAAERLLAIADVA